MKRLRNLFLSWGLWYKSFWGRNLLVNHTVHLAVEFVIVSQSKTSLIFGLRHPKFYSKRSNYGRKKVYSSGPCGSRSRKPNFGILGTVNCYVPLYQTFSPAAMKQPSLHRNFVNYDLSFIWCAPLVLKPAVYATERLYNWGRFVEYPYRSKAAQ